MGPECTVECAAAIVGWVRSEPKGANSSLPCNPVYQSVVYFIFTIGDQSGLTMENHPEN